VHLSLIRLRFVAAAFALAALLGGSAAAQTATRATTRPVTQPTTQATQPTTQLARPVQLGPIRVEEIHQTVDDKPIRGWAAKVDLSDPHVEIRVTGPIERQPDDPPRIEARSETTPAWLAREKLTLAVNTHFFARLDDGKGPYPESCPLDLIGPCISAGRVVSPGRDDGRASPVLAFTKDRKARVAMLTPPELEGMYNVVSGVSESHGKTGGLLVEDGKNTGETALVAPTVRHPRTAAGLSKDGHTLILVVIDGRQPEWSIGVTLPEMGDILIQNGAAAAVALDGGGSSSFVFAPPDAPQVTNRPSDGGRWRPVGANLGVYLAPPEPTMRRPRDGEIREVFPRP
jgi:hypothetical protein